MKKNTEDRIIAALLSTSTVREAAEVAGVSERTIYTRLKEKDFKASLEKTRRELWKGHTQALQGQLGKAIDTIVEIMDGDDVPPQVRLNAASEIIRSGMKLTELVDVVERVDALERFTEDNGI